MFVRSSEGELFSVNSVLQSIGVRTWVPGGLWTTRFTKSGTNGDLWPPTFCRTLIRGPSDSETNFFGKRWILSVFISSYRYEISNHVESDINLM